MNLPLRKLESERGDFFVVRTDPHEFHLGFGNLHFAIEDLEKKYPVYRLKQVHGIDIILASEAMQEADGHYSSECNQVLTIQTADCLPVLALNAKTGITMALHAGWRGLFGGIVQWGLSMSELQPLSSCYVFAGPHLQKDSFEVQEDVFPLIKTALQRVPSVEFADIVSPKANGRYCVNMAGFLKAEVSALGLPEKHLWMSSIDTLTSDRHFSYRGQNPTGRLISYIFRTPPPLPIKH